MVKSNWCIQPFSWIFFYLENQWLWISSNFTPKTSNPVALKNGTLGFPGTGKLKNMNCFFYPPCPTTLDAVCKNTPGTKEWKLSCITVLLGGSRERCTVAGKLVNEKFPKKLSTHTSFKYGRGMFLLVFFGG